MKGSALNYVTRAGRKLKIFVIRFLKLLLWQGGMASRKIQLPQRVKLAKIGKRQEWGPGSINHQKFYSNNEDLWLSLNVILTALRTNRFSNKIPPPHDPDTENLKIKS